MKEYQYLSLTQAAQYLKIGKSTFQKKYKHSYNIPHLKKGRTVIFRTDLLDEWYINELKKEEYKPKGEVSTAIKSLTKLEELPTAYHGRGCSKCRFTGYQGRTVITELLVLSEKIRELTIARRHASEIDSHARKEGMTSLFMAGIDKVHRGITTYDEVLKVTKGTVNAD